MEPLSKGSKDHGVRRRKICWRSVKFWNPWSQDDVVIRKFRWDRKEVPPLFEFDAEHVPRLDFVEARVGVLIRNSFLLCAAVISWMTFGLSQYVWSTSCNTKSLSTSPTFNYFGVTAITSVTCFASFHVSLHRFAKVNSKIFIIYILNVKYWWSRRDRRRKIIKTLFQSFCKVARMSRAVS